ncbi:hypothetical protein JVU11DRAFT_7964 [Chiua virens]|nr:hypothetical protein JVU11DRAFT_7964 [Chiua virens]
MTGRTVLHELGCGGKPYRQRDLVQHIHRSKLRHLNSDIRRQRCAEIENESRSASDERGNRMLIIICLINMSLLYPATKAYYLWRNRQRAEIWDAMTPEASALDAEKRRALTWTCAGESALSQHDHRCGE